MRKRIIFAAALCLGTMYPAYNASAATEVTQEVQQAGTIRGKVVDNNGEPVIGANIMVKGTTNGVITDIDGNFVLTNAKGTLVISYIGYKTVELPIGNKTTFNVKLVEDSELLSEVVVTGYGSAKKASLTSAITQVKGDDVFKNRGIANTTLALQGEVPGLVVTRSSTRPGSEGAAIKIRGDVSMNGNDPLIIIDGVAGSLSELNSMDGNDIENISVLKDASAAIYGARSASGVVLVTTKRGRKGKAQVSYSGTVSRTIDGIQAPLTNNQEWLDMFFEAQYYDTAASNPKLTDPREIYQNLDWWIFKSFGGQSVTKNSKGKWAPNYKDIDPDTGAPMMYKHDKLFNALRAGRSIFAQNGNKIESWMPSNYMLDAFYGQATSQKHSVSISGADEKFAYRASLSYSDANSQLKVAEDGEKKYGARLNADYQPIDILKFETGMSYEKKDKRTPSTDVGGGYFDPWFWAFLNENGDAYDTFSGNRNPYGGLLQGGQNTTSLSTFRATGKVTLDLNKWVKGLDLSATGAYKMVREDYTEQVNKVQYYDWAGTETGNKQGPGSLKEQNKKWENVTLGAFANYDRMFMNVHHVKAMLGMTAEQETYKQVGAKRNMGPLYPGSDLVDLDVWISGTNNEAYGGQNSWGFVSYLTRLNYDYAGKYLVEFLGRRDGSSKLVKEQRWKNFYSVSGGWIISNEDFMKRFTWLSNLKLRYNYGKMGSVNGIGNYESYALIKTGGTVLGVSPSSHASFKLDGMRSGERSWETIESHNAGIDIAFLDHRLNGSFDYFVKTNTGMFIGVTYPSILGAGAPKSNDGKFRTKGWEATVNWRDQIGGVKYNLGFSLADYKSKVLQFTDMTNVPFPGNLGRGDRIENWNGNAKNYYLVGKSLSPVYVFQTDGIFQTQEEVDAYYEMYYWNADHTAPKAGNIIPAPADSGTGRLRPGARKVVDLDGDGVITKDDIYYAGDRDPHLTFTIKAGLEWKGIDVSAFFQGVGNQVVLRQGQIPYLWRTNYVMQNKTYMGKTWTPENTGAEYTIASRDQNFNAWNYQYKDVSLQKNRYIRLKSLVVGYTLPKQWTAKAGLNKVRLYFSGDDLWEWTKVKDGYDPEFGEETNNSFPFSRLLSFGVDVTF